MLLHLAMMLSKASGWGLPSDDKAHDSPISSHDSAITGEVDSARDGRRLASSCDHSWSVSPRPAHLFLPCLTVLAFLLAATHQRRCVRLWGHRWGTPAGVSQSPARASLPLACRACAFLPALSSPNASPHAPMSAVTHTAMAHAMAHATTVTSLVFSAVMGLALPAAMGRATTAATPAATPAVPPAPLASTAPQARHSWPHAPWPSRLETSPRPSAVSPHPHYS